jgi:hypothetical protein
MFSLPLCRWHPAAQVSNHERRLAGAAWDAEIRLHINSMTASRVGNDYPGPTVVQRRALVALIRSVHETAPVGEIQQWLLRQKSMVRRTRMLQCTPNAVTSVF